MKFNIKKEKRCQYFSPDNASTALFSNALNKHIAYLNKKYEDLVLLCIGTDKITGDCLGPLVGSKLMQQNFPHPLYGTLEKPLHAGNLTRQLPEISIAHPNACTLAIDAAVGSLHHHPQILLVLRPRYNPPGHHRQIQYHTNHKNILDVPEITAKTLYTIHKTQTVPEDDTVLYFFSLVVPPYSIRSIRYPIPICVCIYWSPFLSGSSFLRNVAINTLNEATSFCEQLPQICCVI